MHLSTNAIIQMTGDDVERLAVLVKNGDEPQKLHVEKLGAAFNDVMKLYQSTRKVC